MKAPSSTGQLNPGATRLGRVYGRYIPRLIIERLRREARAVDAPSSESVRGAILFADISGFTPLTESFAERGPEGAEELTRILNDYFGRMCEIVFDHGGDVLKFAGDALMALWRPDADGGDASAVCAQAVLCGKALQDGLAGYTAEGHPLSLRVAVGFGEAMVWHVGGQFGRWEFAIAGAPLNQVGRIGALADPGDVLLSTEIVARLRVPLKAEMVLNPEADPELTEWPPRRMLDIRRVEAQRASPPRDLPLPLQEALRGYLPASITQRISAGQTDFLGELRRLTVLFVNLPDITYKTPLEQAQQAFSGLQKALYIPWEGSINKLSVDDKGISLVAALGLPPFAHEDDPARGALAALAMHRTLTDMGQRCSIGVSTGRVYCGSVGGSGRQEYTIMGDRVNLAARLMQHAAGGILCDADTEARSRDQVRYSDGAPLTVKGKSEALVVYRPEAAVARSVKGQGDEGLLIGREDEIDMLRMSLAALLESGRSGLVYVEGEAGVGKTRLIDQFVATEARSLPVRILRGNADAIDRITPYHAFQQVILDLFALHDDGAADRRDRVRRALSDDAAAIELLPLLDDVLPMEFPETELTAQMTGELRASNLQSLMVSLLQHAATARPLLIVIDDAHWLDSASWELLRACVRRVTPLLAIVTGRPLTSAEMPEALRGFLAASETMLLNLDRMDPDQCIELVQHRLGVTTLPPAAARLIRERGEGHPYFSEEIGYALRDSGALIIDGQVARMAREGHEAEDLDLPDTIEGIITSRIDRLTPQQQLALKVASCIGRVFPTRLLHDIYPVEEDRAGLGDELQRLAGIDLTPAEPQDSEETWAFKHAITRQVAYDLMLYAQRKTLHRAIAQWYEREHADDLEPHYPMLAHHWSRAEDGDWALHYLPLAAASALAANAATEAIEFLHQAQQLVASDQAPAPPPIERARWLVMLGRAENALGRIPEARAAFEAALELLDQSVPRGRLGLLTAIGNQIRIQARHRRRGAPPAPEDREQAERLALATQTVERLFLVYVFANENTRAFWTVLRATNLAEATSAESPLLIRCYTDLAVALTSIPAPIQARHYAGRAMEMAKAFPEDLIDNAWAHLGTALCLVGDGDWGEIERRTLVSRETNNALGDLRRWEEASANTGLIRTLQGRFDDAEDGVYAPMLAAARKRGVRQSEGWALSLWGMNLIFRQEFDDLGTVTSDLKSWLEALTGGIDDYARLDALAVLTFDAARRGDAEQLAEQVAAGMALVRGLGRPSQYRLLPALYLFTESVIDAWRHASDSERRARRRDLERLLKCLQSYAGIFAIGAPRLAWLEGRIAWHEGRERAALRAWRRALDGATTLEMNYDAMLAARSLANCLPDADAEERGRCAARADTLTDAMGIPGSGFVCTR